MSASKEHQWKAGDRVRWHEFDPGSTNVRARRRLGIVHMITHTRAFVNCEGKLRPVDVEKLERCDHSESLAFA